MFPPEKKTPAGSTAFLSICISVCLSFSPCDCYSADGGNDLPHVQAEGYTRYESFVSEVLPSQLSLLLPANRTYVYRTCRHTFKYTDIFSWQYGVV